MPELPEVETVVRGLIPILQGQRIASVALRRKDLRFAFPADFQQRLQGRSVAHVARRAKYILVGLDDGATLLIHLGMTGRFSVIEPQQARPLTDFYHAVAQSDTGEGPHDHVLFTLGNGTRLVFTDPRRFGLMDVADAGAVDDHKLLKHLGVEPLGNHLSAAYLAEKFNNRKVPLKSILLDQRIIAGLGNIYVNEALFRTELSPFTLAQSLSAHASIDPRLEALVRHIKDVLAEAILAGGSTLQDFVGADGGKGQFQQRFAVYDRANEPCLKKGCSGTIARVQQAGRSSFYCPTCQRD